MSATVLGAKIAHYVCFEDESTVIELCPPCSVLDVACLGYHALVRT